MPKSFLEFNAGSPYPLDEVFKDRIPGLNLQVMFEPHPIIGAKTKRVIGWAVKNGLKAGVAAVGAGIGLAKETSATMRSTSEAPADPGTSMAVVDDLVARGLRLLEGPRRLTDGQE